jgi:O-antigen ligase
LKKWAILLGGIALAIALGRRLRPLEWIHPWIVGALGFLPFMALKRTSISVVFENYPRGDSMGLEVTLVDFVALLALFALPARRAPLPYRVVVPLYGAVALFSLVLAPEPLLGFFSFWKLARMVLVMVALARAFQHPDRPASWLRGVALGVGLAFFQASMQRFVEGLGQSMGTFPHQNSMGMAMNLVIPIVLSIALAGQGRVIAWVTLGCASSAVVLSLSRGSMTMMLIGVVLTYVVSCVRHFSWRKNLIALGALTAGALLLAVSFGSIARRFETAPEVSALGREIYEDEAHLMLHDHPLGVGLNQWSHVSANEGYGERAGLLPMDVGGIAHNIYWLTLAELGYFGFITFLLLLAAPLRWAVPAVWRRPDDIRGDVLAGVVVGLIVTDLHGTLEWAWRQTQVGYLYWSIMALAWTLSRQLAPSRLR